VARIKILWPFGQESKQAESFHLFLCSQSSAVVSLLTVTPLSSSDLLILDFVFMKKDNGMAFS